MSLTNLTNPGADPMEGDRVEYKMPNGTRVVKVFHAPAEPTAEDIAQGARSWRDLELQRTDWIVPVTDHPQHAAYLAYRQALRDWPSTADFPDTKPVLGS
jgi:hypothetical protein